MKYHYIYRITNIKLNKHYYGARGSINPQMDLGIKYFSSSKDKEFIHDQKENPHNYKYKIIKIFQDRKDAIQLEIKLHNRFNVGINESFYNRCKQTSTGWDTTGMKFKMCQEGIEKSRKSRTGKKLSKKHRKSLSEAKMGNKNNNYGKHFTEEHKRKISESNIGKKHTKESKKKMSKSQKGKILSDEHKKNLSNSLIGVKKSKEHCKNISKGKSGHKHSKQTKKRMSDSKIGKAPWNKGKTGKQSHNSETKEIIRISMSKSKWINNGIINKGVQHDNLNDYLSLSWKLGRLKNAQK